MVSSREISLGAGLSQIVRNLLAQLVSNEPEAVESDTVEVKGWCKDESELATKLTEAVMCLANTRGGVVLVGIEDRKISGFRSCPHRNVTENWLRERIYDLSFPPVQGCTVEDASEMACELTGLAGITVYAIHVPTTRRISGHRSAKGVAKKRVGKQCRPEYFAEDDRSACFFPGATLSDLSSVAIATGMAHHPSRFRPTGVPASQEDFLAASGLIGDADRSPTLAAVLLFGSELALRRLCPQFETIVVTPFGEERRILNIVESVDWICSTSSKTVMSCPGLDLTALREVLVNAYVHRCYRTAAPVLLTVEHNRLQIESPGGLLGGLTTGNLLHCVPIYRNFLLADGARFCGLCDKIGQGINLIYRAALGGGFSFPIFDGDDAGLTVRIPLDKDARFRRFVEARAQSLSELDYLIVLRRLWPDSNASPEELGCAMQRGIDATKSILSEMERKLMIELADLDQPSYRLGAAVRGDLENLFGSQLPLAFPPGQVAPGPLRVPKGVDESA